MLRPFLSCTLGRSARWTVLVRPLATYRGGGRCQTASRGLQRLSSTVASTSSTSVEYLPSPTAPREAPTPLVFVSCKSIEEQSARGFATLASVFAEKGFSSLHADIRCELNENETPEACMDRCASELKKRFSASNVPFPPVLVGRSLGCLIAQTYVSSYPVKALALISPPPTNKSINQLCQDQDLSEKFWELSKLPEFTFEPDFPIAIFGLPENFEYDRLVSKNRLALEGIEVVRIAENVLVGGAEGQDMDIIVKLEEWLDELGV